MMENTICFIVLHGFNHASLHIIIVVFFYKMSHYIFLHVCILVTFTCMCINLYFCNYFSTLVIINIKIMQYQLILSWSLQGLI